MIERGDQVQRLLATLNKHAEIVADAFDGTVESGDRARNAGIEALVGVGALKPSDEDRYRLNPRLRDFIADHLVSYRAFTALTRLAGPISQLRQQWSELKQAHRDGLDREAERLEIAAEETIDDIAYTIARNLALLQSMVMTQYGNVASLQSKLRQNDYYDKEINLSLAEVQQVEALAASIATDPLAISSLPHIRQLVTRRLGARMLEWTSSIKDAKATITNRLFEARLLEQKLKRTARYALWLARNRTQDGWDIDVKDGVPAALVRIDPPQLRPQPDVQSADESIQVALLAAVAKLPEQKQLEGAVPEDVRQPVMADAMETEQDLLEPHELALQSLIEHLASTRARTRLGSWREQRSELAEMGEEHWLVYASTQLRIGGYAVRYIAEDGLELFPINQTFYDVEVEPVMAGRVA